MPPYPVIIEVILAKIVLSKVMPIQRCRGKTSGVFNLAPPPPPFGIRRVSVALIKPCFHLQQTPRPLHKNKAIMCSSFSLIALFWFKIGLCRGRNWLYGNQLKGELQHENKLISYERAFKMLENDMSIAGIGQAAL